MSKQSGVMRPRGTSMGRGNAPFWYEYGQSGRRNVLGGKAPYLHEGVFRSRRFWGGSPGFRVAVTLSLDLPAKRNLLRSCLLRSSPARLRGAFGLFHIRRPRPFRVVPRLCSFQSLHGLPPRRFARGNPASGESKRPRGFRGPPDRRGVRAAVGGLGRSFARGRRATASVSVVSLRPSFDGLSSRGAFFGFLDNLFRRWPPRAPSYRRRRASPRQITGVSLRAASRRRRHRDTGAQRVGDDVPFVRHPRRVCRDSRRAGHDSSRHLRANRGAERVDGRVRVEDH